MPARNFMSLQRLCHAIEREFAARAAATVSAQRGCMPVTCLPFSRRTLMTGLAGGVLAATAPGAASRAQSQSSGNLLKISTIGLDVSDFHRHTGSIGVVQV